LNVGKGAERLLARAERNEKKAGLIDKLPEVSTDSPGGGDKKSRRSSFFSSPFSSSKKKQPSKSSSKPGGFSASRGFNKVTMSPDDPRFALLQKITLQQDDMEFSIDVDDAPEGEGVNRSAFAGGLREVRSTAFTDRKLRLACWDSGL
jgi:hypothetical protein